LRGRLGLACPLGLVVLVVRLVLDCRLVLVLVLVRLGLVSPLALVRPGLVVRQVLVRTVVRRLGARRDRLRRTPRPSSSP
jgi:hypothetical protein